MVLPREDDKGILHPVAIYGLGIYQPTTERELLPDPSYVSGGNTFVSGRN